MNDKTLKFNFSFNIFIGVVDKSKIKKIFPGFYKINPERASECQPRKKKGNAAAGKEVDQPPLAWLRNQYKFPGPADDLYLYDYQNRQASGSEGGF